MKSWSTLGRAAADLVPPPGQRVLPSLSGALLVSAFPPFHLLVPSFVALVPLLLYIYDRPGGAAGRAPSSIQLSKSNSSRVPS